MVDFLCSDCNAHFKKVLDSLDYINVPYLLNPYLVRGLDYYTKTVFEFFETEMLDESSHGKDASTLRETSQPSPSAGGFGGQAGQAGSAQIKTEDKKGSVEPGFKKRLAVASGGRYDSLVKLLGGPPTPGVGVAIGVDRILQVIKEQKKEPRII